MIGKSLIAIGQYDAALNIFDNVTTPGLEYIVSKEEKGNALAGLKRYEESCMAFDEAIEPNRFPVADLWSGVCNQTTSQCEPKRTTNGPLTAYDREFYTGLLKEYDDQLKTQKNDPDLWIKRGETMINLMRYDEAVASFERSISIKPKNAPAQNGKGVALFYTGNNTLALEAFDQAVRIDSGSVKSWNNGAFVFMKQGNYTKAAQTYQKALYYAHRQKDPQGTGDFQFEMVF